MKDRANGTFKVTDDFQFGQAKKSGEGRFLVYHDPKRIKIHQVRWPICASRKMSRPMRGMIV